MKEEKIILGNERFSLTLNPDATCESLRYLPTGEECLYEGERLPFFCLTEQRPYNNEIKLAYPNKQTTFYANRVRREGNLLIVGFELILLEAEVEIVEKQEYLSFRLNRIITPEGAFGLGTIPMQNVVCSFGLMRLAVKERSYFGQWLNIVWDEKVAINVLASCPYATVDCEQKNGYKILSCTLLRDVKLEGAGACLITCGGDEVLDCIDAMERDFGLPRGAQSRKRKETYYSIYATEMIYPNNVDEQIRLAKKGGFGAMKIYYQSIYKVNRAYDTCGAYEYNRAYPNGDADLKYVLDRVRAAGIIPGLHILHTHIGTLTSYVTPKADTRLNLTKTFTLARPISAEDTTIYVEQNPATGIRHEKGKVARIGTEIVRFEAVGQEYPYCLIGCERGYYNTEICAHPKGEAGGILDVSEFAGVSIYIDQNTDLQDEIAKKIAHACDLGFEFVYFDGAEGVNPPYEINVPLAQYRVFKQIRKEPIYCEGAAKAHFSWHMLAGGNAFDSFRTAEFKQKFVEHPMAEAKRMKMDFTRVDTGWWAFWEDTQPDTYEFAMSKSLAMGCVGSLAARGSNMRANPRTDDVFEVLRRWQDFQKKGLMTPALCEMLQDPKKEYTLLLDEAQEYEVAPYFELTQLTQADNGMRAFYFERNCNDKSKRGVVYWCTRGNGTFALPLDASCVTLKAELYLDDMPISTKDGVAILPAEGKRYLITDLSKEQLEAAFCAGTLTLAQA